MSSKSEDADASTRKKLKLFSNSVLRTSFEVYLRMLGSCKYSLDCSGLRLSSIHEKASLCASVWRVA